MVKIPVFKTEEEEAEFWAKNSPLDFFNSVPEKVVVKKPKDRVLTIRLDSESRAKLEELAEKHNVGSSTLVRLILMSALRNLVSTKEVFC